MGKMHERGSSWPAVVAKRPQESLARPTSTLPMAPAAANFASEVTSLCNRHMHPSTMQQHGKLL